MAWGAWGRKLVWKSRRLGPKGLQGGGFGVACSWGEGLPSMDTTGWVTGLLAAAAAVAGAWFTRQWLAKRQGQAVARHVEAERIVALLSARQPGVWDVDDLRERVVERAKACWASSSLEDLARLETWVSPRLLAELRAWPQGATKREVRLRMEERPRFVSVTEGGGGPDRLVAKLMAGWDAIYLDARGKRVKQERRSYGPSFHTWLHVDGQGWMLDAMGGEEPMDEPAPSSVMVRVLPRAEAADDGGR